MGPLEGPWGWARWRKGRQALVLSASENPSNFQSKVCDYNLLPPSLPFPSFLLSFSLSLSLYLSLPFFTFFFLSSLLSYFFLSVSFSGGRGELPVSLIGIKRGKFTTQAQW